MSSLYHSPEHFNLEVIYEHRFPANDAYEFDLRVVWRHTTTGKLYTARDAGCSCPVPFEKYTSLQELEELPPGTTDFKGLDRDDY